MAIIWLVEDPNRSPYALTKALQGEFPVRTFASIASLLRLLPISSRPSPDLSLIIVPGDYDNFKSVERAIHQRHPRCAVVFIAQSNTSPLVINDFPIEGLGQLQYVKNLLIGFEYFGTAQRMGYRDIELDPESRILSYTHHEAKIELSTREFHLLKFLLENANQCVARKSIHFAVWGKGAISPRSIDVQVSRLRKYLSCSSVSIETVYGGGYLLR